jgi:uncharacterized protein (DUF302 family)
MFVLQRSSAQAFRGARSHREIHSMALWIPKRFGISKFVAVFSILAVSAQKSEAQKVEWRFTCPSLTNTAPLPPLRSGLSFRPPSWRGQMIQDGIVRVKSAHAINETISRIKKDVADKGVRFFSEIDQSKVAADAGIKLRPSTLLVFGNPPLGTQFIASNPNAGLDWPVRLLVTQDDDGSVWGVYTDFGWIAKRHGIVDREAHFKMASQVIGAITSSIAAKK